MTSETSATLTPADARRAARNAGAIAAASLLSRGLQFGWQLILAPGLGPAAYGIYGAVAAFILIGSAVPNFGMGPIVIRDVARHPEQAGKYLTSTLFMQTILALLAYIGINAAAFLGGYSDTLRVFVAIAGLNLLVDVLGSMCNDLLLARERMLASSVVTVTHIALLISLAGLGLAAGFGLVGVYLGALLAGLARTAALWALVLRAGLRPAWPFDRAVAWPLLRNGAPLALAAFMVLAYQQVDKLLTNRLIGDRETGYLTAAFLIIFGVIELLSTTILTATYPLMSRFTGDERAPLFGFMVQKISFFTLVISLPISLTLSIFAAQITVPLFGAGFSGTADILRLLIWYALVTMFANVLAQGLMVQNRQGQLLRIRALGLGVNILLLLALLPAVGVRGAALASIGAELLALALMLRIFRAPGWEGRLLLPRLLRLGALGLLAGAVMLALSGAGPIIGAAAGLALFAVGVLRGGILTSDDWDLLYRLAAAMPGGGLIRRCWRRDVAINW